MCDKAVFLHSLARDLHLGQMINEGRQSSVTNVYFYIFQSAVFPTHSQ